MPRLRDAREQLLRRWLRMGAVLCAASLSVASAMVVWLYPRWYRPPSELGTDWPHEVPRLLTALPERSARPGSVIIVTLDGVRWQEVFDGVDKVLAGKARRDVERVRSRDLLPNIYRHLIDRGVALGHPDATGGFCVSNEHSTSLAGYQELMTARPTGCISNGCGPNQSATIITQLLRKGLRCGELAVVTSWPLAAGHGVSARGLVDLGVDRHLANVGATVAALMGVEEMASAPLCEVIAAVPCADAGSVLRPCSPRR